MYQVSSASAQPNLSAQAWALLMRYITYNISNFNVHTRVGLFSNLKHLLAQKRIELLDDAELLRQLRNLRQEKTERGQVDVRPSPGINADLAVALAAGELCRQTPALPLTPFEILYEHRYQRL